MCVSVGRWVGVCVCVRGIGCSLRDTFQVNRSTLLDWHLLLLNIVVCRFEMRDIYFEAFYRVT